MYITPDTNDSTVITKMRWKRFLYNSFHLITLWVYKSIDQNDLYVAG